MAPKEGGLTERAAGRWAVTAGGGFLVVSCLVLVYVSPPPIYFENFRDEKPAVAGVKPSETGGGASASATVATPAAPAKETSSAPAKESSPAPVAAAPGPVPADAWPVFRGPFGLGVAGHKNAPLKWNGKTGENLRWKVEIPKPGTNSPIVWGKRVFVSGGDSTKREVYCYDSETGKLLWSGDDSGIPGSTPPSLKVTEDTSYCASTLATDGDQVYAVFANGDVMAFSMDGKRQWAWSPGAFKISYGYGSSLNVYPGRVLVQFDNQGGGHLIALDSKTGKPLYDQKRDVKSSWATPVVANTGKRWEVILNAPPHVMGHDPATGKILWKIECMGDTEVAPSPGFGGGIAVVAQERAALVGIQTGGEARILWKLEDDLPDVSSPVVAGKYVLMASSAGMVTCLEAQTGKKVWNKEFDDGFYSSPVVVDDRVYLMDKTGVTVVFKLGDKYEELAKNVLGEKSNCTPAIPEGRIYLRSDRFLYSIGKGGS
jgi:outer membrane protein assembly factor BamB